MSYATNSECAEVAHANVSNVDCHIEAFTDLAHLSQSLCRKVGKSVMPVSIVGGHYMLMYSHAKRSLEPMIIEEADCDDEILFIRDQVGSFPTDSFSIALDIVEQLPRNAGKIALLVNDHQYQRIQPDVASLQHGQLRKEYYRNNAEIPKSYRKLIADRQLTVASVVQRNDKPPRIGKGILPKNTPFFSEQNLRNIFNDMTQPALLRDKSIDPFVFDRCTLEFSKALETSQVTDARDLRDTNCSCSGEVLQLLYELCYQYGNSSPRARSTVLIVPTTCARSVCAGVSAAVRLCDALADVRVVWGVESIREPTIAHFGIHG